MLDMLKETYFNWFAFTALLEPLFRNHGYDSKVFDKFLHEFASQLPELGLTDDELKLTEQSRAAYLAPLEQKELELDMLCTLSDSTDVQIESDGEKLEPMANDQDIQKGLKKKNETNTDSE